jgi:hypothetical protein
MRQSSNYKFVSMTPQKRHQIKPRLYTLIANISSLRVVIKNTQETTVDVGLLFFRESEPDWLCKALTPLFLPNTWRLPIDS